MFLCVMSLPLYHLNVTLHICILIGIMSRIIATHCYLHVFPAFMQISIKLKIKKIKKYASSAEKVNELQL